MRFTILVTEKKKENCLCYKIMHRHCEGVFDHLEDAHRRLRDEVFKTFVGMLKKSVEYTDSFKEMPSIHQEMLNEFHIEWKDYLTEYKIVRLDE